MRSPAENHLAAPIGHAVLWVVIATLSGLWGTSLAEANPAVATRRSEDANPPPLPLASQTQAPQTHGPFHLEAERHVLDNGLEVLMHPNMRLPWVAINVWYHVGPAHEPKGRSGFAHLFEHLMFEGSKYAGRQFDPLLESVGGTNMNGTTSWDRTNYYETVPSEHLELALWLEADRMGFMLDTLTQERLDAQRDVVLNERRQSYENSPYGPSWLAVYENLYPPEHPYHGAVIGSPADLNAATFEDVSSFFKTFYVPGNATIALAGHFDPGQARGWLDKYFSTLPQTPQSSTRASPGAVATEETTPPRRVVVREPVELRQLIWAWRVPPAFGPDHAPLDLCAELLGSGQTSRLNQELVLTGLANSVAVELDDGELGSTFTIEVLVASNHSVTEVERVLTQQLGKLSTAPVGREELQRVRAKLNTQVASSLQHLNAYGGDGGQAGAMQYYSHYLGDPNGLEAYMAEMDTLPPEQINRVARKWLSPDNHLTVVTEPMLTETVPSDPQLKDQVPEVAQ